MQDRGYQIEARDAVDRELAARRSTILCLPTGAGKTYVAVSTEKMLQEKYRNFVTVWFAHRAELVDQAVKSFCRLGMKPTLWTANSKELSPLTIAMVQSTRTLPSALRDYADGRPLRSWVDEVHHNAAASYIRLQEEIPWTDRVGLTATPVRLDGKDLGYDSIAYSKTFLDVVELGYLAKPRYVRIHTDLDYDLGNTKGDFQVSRLTQLNNPTRNELIIEEYLQNQEQYGKTILFAVNRDHGRALLEIARKAGIEASAYVDGTMDSKHRDAVIDWFKNDVEPGHCALLINVELFVEGLDIPDSMSVILTRPTKSKVKYMQQIGRAARGGPSSGLPWKTTFNIVDIADNIGHFAHVIEGWSISEFGAPEDPKLAEERADAAYKEQKFAELTDAANACRGTELEPEFKITARVKREIANIVGILRYSTRKGGQIMAVTEKQYKLLDKLQNVIYSQRHLPSDVLRYEGEQLLYKLGGRGVFNKYTWLGITWAIWHKLVKKSDFRDTDAGRVTTFSYVPLGTQL